MAATPDMEGENRASVAGEGHSVRDVGHAILHAPNGREELRRHLADRPVHDMTGLVALEDLGDALLRAQRLTGWAGGDVGVGEGIGEWRHFGRELSGEDVRQASGRRFGPRARVVRDEPAEAVRRAESAEVTGAVEWVEASVEELGAVTDVVEPRRGHEQLGVRRVDIRASEAATVATPAE